MSTFLMLWNPKAGNLSDEDWEEQGKIINDEGLDSLWSVGNRKSGVAVGDMVFLVRTISERGIVRSGVVTGDLVHEEHWNPDRAAEGAKVNYAPVRWTKQLPIEARLPVETLLREVPEVRWNNLYASGIRVHDTATEKLRKLWAEAVGGDFAISPAVLPTGQALPSRTTTIVERIVRDSAVSQRIKDLYGHQCQICRSLVAVPSGFYAEGAHIRPLGKPHAGQDTPDNILCLCPTCHVRFDSGAITISDDLVVEDCLLGEPVGPLLVEASHAIERANLAYHRDRIAEVL
jgi:hypothetical protein